MKINGILAVAVVGLTALSTQAQVIIDTLTGSTSSYSTYLVNDGSSGAGRGVSLSTSTSGLSASYSGTGTTAEQALFLATGSSFGVTFSVGDTMYVSVNTPASATLEDFGLAIGSASPVAASSANNYNSRTNFDWASISVRPSQNSIRVNYSTNSGSAAVNTLNTGNYVAGVGTTANISELWITWLTANSFSLGYVSNSVSVTDATIYFSSSSTIGTDIGFYADLRATSGTLGTISDLTIVPEPSTVALCGLGAFGLVATLRRKK